MPLRTFSKKQILNDVITAGIPDIECLSFVLRNALNISIATKNNCLDPKHCSPFSFVSDALLTGLRKAVVWANRSGGKSFNFGLITFLRSMVNASSGTRILGGSADQSRKVYAAFTSFFNACEMHGELLAKEPTQYRTDYRNGSQVEILTASMTSVRGGHQPFLVLDEVEEMDRELFEAALSQPQSMDGVQSSLFIGSTYHRIAGVMEYILNGKIAQTSKVYAWCIWEVLESCRDYSCSTCKLKPYCPGEHMKQADGYYRIPDFIDKLETLSMRSLNAEWLCKEPSREGLVINAFEPKAYPAGHFVSAAFNPGKPVYLAFDFGATRMHPYVILVIQRIEQPLGWCVVEQYINVGDTTPRIIEQVRGRSWFRPGARAFADPSRPDLIALWQEAGIDMQGVQCEINAGNEMINGLLKPALGQPLLYVSTACQNVRIGEFEYGILHDFDNYIYPERATRAVNPVDRDNHAPEALRRFCAGMGELLHDVREPDTANKEEEVSMEVGIDTDRPTQAGAQDF